MSDVCLTDLGTYQCSNFCFVSSWDQLQRLVNGTYDDVESGDYCVDVGSAEECIRVSIYDSFGDGLNHGEGDWNVDWNGQMYYSPSAGDSHSQISLSTALAPWSRLMRTASSPSA